MSVSEVLEVKGSGVCWGSKSSWKSRTTTVTEEDFWTLSAGETSFRDS